jgi:acyl-CoA thioester hydrolase
MPRLKLKELDTYRFSTTLNVRVTDVNYGGHLGNDAVAGLIQQARVEVLKGLGASEMDLGDGQTGLIQSDLAIVFKGEGFLGDELRIDVEFTERKGSSFRNCYRIVKDDVVIILAEAGFSAFDYNARKTVPLPGPFRVAISNSDQ